MIQLKRMKTATFALLLLAGFSLPSFSVNPPNQKLRDAINKLPTKQGAARAADIKGGLKTVGKIDHNTGMEHGRLNKMLNSKESVGDLRKQAAAQVKRGKMSASQASELVKLKQASSRMDAQKAGVTIGSHRAAAKSSVPVSRPSAATAAPKVVPKMRPVSIRK